MNNASRPAGLTIASLLAPQPPPDAGERETKAERRPPGKVEKQEIRSLLKA